jgi:hypothetical protein
VRAVSKSRGDLPLLGERLICIHPFFPQSIGGSFLKFEQSAAERQLVGTILKMSYQITET